MVGDDTSLPWVIEKGVLGWWLLTRLNLVHVPLSFIFGPHVPTLQGSWHTYRDPYQSQKVTETDRGICTTFPATSVHVYQKLAKPIHVSNFTIANIP